MKNWLLFSSRDQYFLLAAALTVRMSLYKAGFDEVTKEINNHVTDWFGDNARIAPNIPELRKLKRSFFVRYGVLFNGHEGTGLLIKIPRPPHAETLSDALDQQHPRESTRREYEFLVACSNIFRDDASNNFCAVRPLGYLPRWNAIAMEELKCRPLKVVDWKDRNLKLASRLSRAAQWLKLFHERMGGAAMERVSSENLRSEFEKRLTRLHSSSLVPSQELPRIHKLLEPRLSKIENAPLLFACLHGDFKCSNILVSEEGRVGAIDSKLRGRGPIYVDLGMLIANVFSARFNVLSFGLFTKYGECRDAIITGYFSNQPFDENALDLYNALFILEKWSGKEFGLKRLGPVSPVFRFFLRKYFSRLVTKCLRAP